MSRGRYHNTHSQYRRG